MERDFIEVYKKEVIQRYFPNHAEGKLKQRDFLYLIDILETKSGANISLSTLKRFWKNEYTHTPQVYTLNALASLLDYADWNAFKNAKPHPATNQIAPQQVANRYKKGIPVAIGLSLVMVLFLGFWLIKPQVSTIIIPNDVTFSVDKTVVHGVPNTVVFNYDLTGARADSFLIQRSWNPTNRAKIDPKGNFFSETYYYPGFHWASLMANDSIIRKKRILIESEGWLATAKYHRLDSIPTYLDQQGIINQGMLYARPQDYQAAGFDSSKDMVVSYHLVQDFDSIEHDHYRLELMLKMDSSNQAVCPYAEVRIIDEVDASWFSLVGQGCEGNLIWKVDDQIINGQVKDLTTFGVDLYQWHKFVIEFIDGEAKVTLNEEQALVLPSLKERGQIKGVILTFNGLGMVDNFRLTKPGSTNAYIDNFE